jgi:uncharacterized protein YPO0396
VKTPGQFRISRLQVFNWGTFSGVHDIPIAERGFLFVGRSGSGKTTLLDAFSVLLVPPVWLNLNAAAREGDRGRDRSPLSYVRGAWAEQRDDDSGLIATQYLRRDTTWSALALTYTDGAGGIVTLVRVFWIKGKSNQSKDLKWHFFVFERAFDLREMQDFQLDVRKLKLKFPEAFAREDFTPYAERFCRRLGIDNQLALKLLHKTQSAKNLGDLNTFLRDFMLDKPETFDAAERLVKEFSELNEAHQAVLIAREQIRTLAPARQDHDSLQSVIGQQEELVELRKGVDGFKETCRAELLRERLSQLAVEIAGLGAVEQSHQAKLDVEQRAIDDLQQEHRQRGGDRIAHFEAERGDAEKIRDERLRKKNQVQQDFQNLGWPAPQTPHAFAEAAARARHELEDRPERREQAHQKRVDLNTQRTGAEKDFAATVREVQALRRQPSNIPADQLELRSRITQELGLADSTLPFAGELIEVLPQEVAWRGAIERALRSFALSVLVPERQYAPISDIVNRIHLGQRLVYLRVGQPESSAAQPIAPNSMVRKLQIKDGAFHAWLEADLRRHNDYACVDSMQAFRNSARALTREGQIRGRNRHEKDDRFATDDRSRWVLGFDNREKLALFEQRAQELAQTIEELKCQDTTVRNAEEQADRRALMCQRLVNIQWQEIDVAPLLERIAAIAQSLREAREGNPALAEIGRRIEKQKEKVESARQTLIGVQAQKKSLENEQDDREGKLNALRSTLKTTNLSEFQSAELAKRFNALKQPLTIDNADRLAHLVDRALDEEQKALEQTRAKLTRSIEERFSEFKRNWPAEASDLDGSLDSASDYFAKLRRLETDRLPDYEHRFFDLLRNQSHQNLAALSTHLNQARKTIFDRLEVVNQSLSKAEFGHGTYLHIEASDRNLEDVRQFRQEIQQALSHAWTDDREQAEERFVILRGLVDRLGSQETEHKRWRELVLDVRQHVEFIGRESDAEGRQVEVYRSGSGKSGGERQKLATTCLAAALRYQLAGDDPGVPRYAPVILDEAFDKADNEFTALAMRIFEGFGFQMVVATPLKSVMTLEPFIGGACFVDITERRHSSVLMVEYDSDRQRLKLPERLHDEAHAAVP